MSSTKLKTPSLTLFCARRCSGKSHLAAYLLYEMAKAKNFDYVLVISPTDFTGFWKAKVGDVNVREDFRSTSTLYSARLLDCGSDRASGSDRAASRRC